MLDYSPLFPQLFELQKLTSRKAELALALAEHYASMRKTEVASDLSMHRRDDHHGSFDIEGHLDHLRDQEQRMSRLRAEYKEVCDRITELTEQLDSLIIAAAF